jgi:hypothetical protein
MDRSALKGQMFLRRRSDKMTESTELGLSAPNTNAEDISSWKCEFARDREKEFLVCTRLGKTTQGRKENPKGGQQRNLGSLEARIA